MEQVKELVSRPRESVTQPGEESPSSSSESAVEAAAARLPKILPTVGLNIARVTVNDTKLTLWVRFIIYPPARSSIVCTLTIEPARVSISKPLTSLSFTVCVCTRACVSLCVTSIRISVGHRIYVEYVRVVSITHEHICRCRHACCLLVVFVCVYEPTLAFGDHHVASST